MHARHANQNIAKTGL
jgi:hypothetical protein